MGLGDFWLQMNNGKKERLSDIKGDIRRETVDKKYQKIFDFFDTNKNGAIEGKEAENFIKIVSKFAGDKTLTKAEAVSVFTELGIKDVKDVDFVDFVNGISEANKKIKTSDVSILPDGSRKVVTNYTNGARLTAVYYPDGELKYTIKELPTRSTNISSNISQTKKGAEVGFAQQNYSVTHTQSQMRKVEFSDRAKMELRQNFGAHFKDTADNILSMIEPFMGDMTFWDRAGIDARQAFLDGDLTELFTADGVKKLEELLQKAKVDSKLGQDLIDMAQNQIGTFEFHLDKDFGIENFDFEKMENFHQTATQYLNAKSLKQRVEMLEKGIKEVKTLYKNALAKRNGVPNSDKLNSDYDKKFMEVLTEYFNGDNGVATAFFNSMKEGLDTGTKDENEENNVLLTILDRIQKATNQTLSESLQGEKFENLESRYKAEFKDIYGREDDTTEVENIIQTGQEIGGTIKIGAMTTIQILISAMTMGTGNAALIAIMNNPLVSYLNAVGTDYALSIAGALSSQNGLTSEKHEQIVQGTVETAKFIGVGSLSAPLCRFVGQTMSKYTGKLFEGGNKVATGNITSTTVSGEHFLQNICTKSANFTGSFGTELGVFAGYEVAMNDEDFNDAMGAQSSMLSQLKVVNKFLQTALGKFVQAQASKGQAKLAKQQYQKFLQDTGLDKASITQYETPTGTRFTGEINGVKFTGTTAEEVQGKLLVASAQKFEGVKKEVGENEDPHHLTPSLKGQENKNEPALQSMTCEEAFSALSETLQKTSNISDLMSVLNVIKAEKGNGLKIDEYGTLTFFDSGSETNYNVEFDGNGNVFKYSKNSYKTNEEKFYIYDKSGNQKEVTKDEYYKVQPSIRTSELRNYIITNPDLLPQKTRDLLLQDENHYYTKEDIDELASMLKTQEDIAIVNKLLNTRGNEHRAIRAIGDALNISQQKFGVRDIIKVLKSEDARAEVLDKIAKNKYVKKTELESLLGGETFSALKQGKFSDESDISYRTKDITLNNVNDVLYSYQTNPQIREQLNKQIPDGEAACINGKMYCRAENTLVPINLDKAIFDRLFPVEERYNIRQGNIGDCYFIAELGGYADTPNGRAALYSSFRQEGNDIIIKFPRYNNIEIKFENGDLNKLSPISIYKHHGQWKIGKGNAHVDACDGIKMIEQAFAFVRNNYTDDNVQITANDKFLMNKQMQELDGSRLGGGSGEAPSLYRNYEVLTCYTSNGFILDGARSVEEGLEVLSKELETNPNVFGSVSFNNSISMDVDEGLYSGHQYRITGYDKKTQMLKIVNPHDSNVYMEVPLEIFKAAEPSFSVFKIKPPEVSVVRQPASEANPNKVLQMKNPDGKSVLDDYAGKEYPYYNDYGDFVEFSAESGAKTLKKTKLQKNEDIIEVSNFADPGGTVAGSSSLNQTLVTDDLMQCSAITIVDKANHRQTLIHLDPGLSMEDNRQIIEHVLSQSKASDLDISVVSGFNHLAPRTVQFVLDTLGELVPDNKINLYKFDKTSTVVVLKDGKISCCDKDNLRARQDNITTNPEGQITYCSRGVNDGAGVNETNPVAQAASDKNNFIQKTAETSATSKHRENKKEVNGIKFEEDMLVAESEDVVVPVSLWEGIVQEKPEGGKIQKSFGKDYNSGEDVYLDSAGNIVQIVDFEDRKNNVISGVNQYTILPDGKVG